MASASPRYARCRLHGRQPRIRRPGWYRQRRSPGVAVPDCGGTPRPGNESRRQPLLSSLIERAHADTNRRNSSPTVARSSIRPSTTARSERRLLATWIPGRPTRACAHSFRLDNHLGQDHGTTMLDCHPRLSASSAVLTCLDHDSGEPVARHGGVTHQEGVFLRGRVRPELREQEATGGDFLVQVPVLRWIGPVDAGSDDGYRTAARRQARPDGQRYRSRGQARQLPSHLVRPARVQHRRRWPSRGPTPCVIPLTDTAGSSATN